MLRNRCKKIEKKNRKIPCRIEIENYILDFSID